MFESIQLLRRIRDHFGKNSVVSIGIVDNIVKISLTIVYEQVRFDVDYWMSMDSIQSNVPDLEIEKMIITKFEQAHMQWEVGEI